MKSKIISALFVCASLAFSQGSTATLGGTVTDPTGAAVPAAEVQLTNASTTQTVKATTNDRGEYAFPAIPGGRYRVTVTAAGFKVATIDNIAMEPGVPANVPVKLEIGQATESVVVSGGAEIVQSTTAEVSSTLTDKQLTDLPFATRNAVELAVDLPGTATPTTPRSSTINGLPKGALNVTIDGMNTQDNLIKSSDGFFSFIMPSVDSLEEVTVQTSAASVDSTGQGGAQIKFVTKSGSNQFHGGGFWQGRNSYFNANYFYNNQQGQPRDVIHLNQEGGHIGGRIIKDKLFFFGNAEIYRQPGTNPYTRNVFTTTAESGIFTYADASGATHQVNLLNLAQAANATLPAGVRPFATTLDPILAKTFAQETSLGSKGIVRPNSTTNNDYNTQTVSYAPTGTDSRNFYTLRLDYNITSKHQLSLVYNYDKYDSKPDFLNNIVPILPGSGTVLFSDVNAGQSSNRFEGTISLRSALTSRLTNEFRGGLLGGTSLFFADINPGLFSTWKGYYPQFAAPGPNTLMNVTATSNPQRRNTPVKNIGDTVAFLKGSHQIQFGGTYDQINFWASTFNTGSIPRVAFGVAAGDPVFTGSTSIFTTANLPGATSTQLGYAAAMYADLTGRVSSTTITQALSEGTHQYTTNQPVIDRDQMREAGFFVQDQWRATPRLTVTAGLRIEKQFSFQNLDNLYSYVSYESLWGTSGVGHLFQPGATGGVTPTFNALTGANTYSMPPVWAPSVGLAYSLGGHEGLAGIFTGHHDGAAVLRGGYNIATIREGMSIYQSIYGGNQGVTQDASISAANYPQYFGTPGSVQFSDPSIPTRPVASSPQYPMAACFTCSVNGFDPNLRLGYVQSWNLGYQRELLRNTVVEVRYNGNHGVKEWRQLSLNEVNIFENGFLQQFKIAQNNLTIARGGNITQNTGVTNFLNQGLPGQQNIPIISTALGNVSDATSATYLMMGQAGTFAAAIGTNAGRMANLTNAGYPSNLFVVNPTIGGGGAFLLTSGGSSYYDAATVELRRRLTHGLLLQGSYTFAKALADGATNSQADFANPTTLRNWGLDKLPQNFDIRHAIKVNGIYQLPFGQGRAFLSTVHNGVVRKAIEGWEIAGVARVQSGTPLNLSGLATFDYNLCCTGGNAAAQGVVLHNITAKQLREEVGVYKTSYPGSTGGIIFYLPPPALTTATSYTAGLNSSNNNNLITNTMAAFNVGGLTPAQVNPNAPYISPAPAGELGWQGQVYLPWQRHFDASISKHTRLGERAEMTISARALNVFNVTNFLPGANTTSSSFGQITSAYRDISGTVDPGGRILEFQARINF